MQAQPGQYGGPGQSARPGQPPQPVQYGEQGQPGQYGPLGQPGAPGPLRGRAPMPGGYPSPNSHQGPLGFQGPTSHQGPMGQHGPMGQRGPGGFAEPGGFAGPVGGPPGNAEGWGGARDWNTAPGWNSVPDWQRPATPAAGPGPGPGPSGYPGYGYPGYGYPGADGYGENVNGGDYAYVISEHGAGPARPSRPRGPERGPADESRPRADRGGQASTDSLRAITAGATGMTRSADPSADAGEAYGRDDPAYGPPGPDWYSREQAASNSGEAAGEPAWGTARAETVQAEDAQAETGQAETAQAAAAPVDLNPQAVRGPFEPLAETARQASAPDAAGTDNGTEGTTPRPWEDGRDVAGGTAWSSADDDLEAAQAGLSEYEPASYEFPGIADDDPAGSADAALDRLKALHLTASAVAPQSLDVHFEQLLERQRKLISEYLGQAGGPGTPAATSITTAAADEDGSLVGFGDDHRSSR